MCIINVLNQNGIKHIKSKLTLICDFNECHISISQLIHDFNECHISISQVTTIMLFQINIATHIPYQGKF
ncbi:hypothetical protein I79_005370 [Cricetulus griseus]|uniref:Uncharacterized protein n=1 Tax=Cricetulus griseus TaxID=10029 RepID=G3H505_CRIGR|nr:hypothetical protein I79_005370 [Cricetulus griseus]